MVDQLPDALLGVRSDDAYRFSRGFRDSVFIGHHVYAHVREDVQATRQSWLDRTFG